MKVARSVAEVLSQHTTLALECIDRLYLNVYVPVLQRAAGAAYFFRKMRGAAVTSSVLMAPITQRFVNAIKGYAERNGIDIVSFRRSERKDDRTQEYLWKWSAGEGVLYIGKAQEKARVLRTERRHVPATGASYAWLVSSTAMVNHFYFYAVDDDFGPFFLKFCSYFPYNAKLCINGHEYLKRQLAKRGHRVRAARQRHPALRGPRGDAAAGRRPDGREDRRAAAQGVRLFSVEHFCAYSSAFCARGRSLSGRFARGQRPPASFRAGSPA